MSDDGLLNPSGCTFVRGVKRRSRIVSQLEPVAQPWTWRDSLRLAAALMLLCTAAWLWVS